MIDPTYKADLINAPLIDLPSAADAQALARAYVTSRPVVDLCRCATPEVLVRAVVAALEGAGLPQAAERFQRRAQGAVGPNALAQIAGDFVELKRSM